MNIPFLQNKIRFTELTAFTRQFAAMAEAKLSLVRILDILYQQTENKQLKNILLHVKTDVEGGKTLTEAFARYSKIFSEFYMNMIRVGEMTGQLDYMLNRVAAYLDKINALRRKLVQALSYPALVILVAVGAVSFLLTYVVPTFAEMFRDFDAELPAITLILMNVSEFITRKLWLVLIGITGLIFGVRAYFKTSRGKWMRDSLSMKLPIAGPILRKNYVSRFSRTLGILLESDISLLEALQVTENSIPNEVVRQEIRQMRFFAEKGEMLTRSLGKSHVFPPMVTQMLTVGEETAQLDRMLNRVADFYDEEIEASLTNLTSILEPLIIVVLGVILGTILVALYMPLFDLVNIVPG
jgi:type IV pilus assembly protein PilC